MAVGARLIATAERGSKAAHQISNCPLSDPRQTDAAWAARWFCRADDRRVGHRLWRYRDVAALRHGSIVLRPDRRGANAWGGARWRFAGDLDDHCHCRDQIREILVLRAQNDGEGGLFALYGLLHEHRKRGTRVLLWALMVGAGLLFGDGMITRAISVISAVEGLRVATPTLGSVVIPITIALLTAVFAVQFKGTSGIGIVFRPISQCGSSSSPALARGRFRFVRKFSLRSTRHTVSSFFGTQACSRRCWSWVR